jgi:hypothetical protein
LLGNLLTRGKNQDPAHVEPVAPFEIKRVKNPVEIAWLDDAREHARAVLALYGAALDDVTGPNLGKKNGRIVAVLPSGSPATAALVTDLVKTIADKARSDVKVDVLARDWILGFDENPSTFSRQGLDVQLVQIPSASDIMALFVGTGLRIGDLMRQEIPSTIQAVVPFYTLPDVSITRKVGNGQLRLTLDGYRLNGGSHSNAQARPGEDPLAIIDYIGIDWDHDGTVFSCSGGSVPTKKNPVVTREFSHQYPVGGSHIVLARVIDAFGHDSSRRGQVDITL